MKLCNAVLCCWLMLMAGCATRGDQTAGPVSATSSETAPSFPDPDQLFTILYEAGCSDQDQGGMPLKKRESCVTYRRALDDRFVRITIAAHEAGDTEEEIVIQNAPLPAMPEYVRKTYVTRRYDWSDDTFTRDRISIRNSVITVTKSCP